MNPVQSESPAAVVTGGSRGIGRAVVLALARQGWDVCLSYASDAAAAETTAAGVRAEGGRVLVVQADGTGADEVDDLRSAVEAAGGMVAGVVMNRLKTGLPVRRHF